MKKNYRKTDYSLDPEKLISNETLNLRCIEQIA